MNKKIIITILLALVAMTGQGQIFTPVVEDSINFVITGTTNTEVDSVTWWQCAPYPQGVSKDYYAPVKDGQFRIEGDYRVTISFRLAMMREMTFTSSWKKHRHTSTLSRVR